MVSHCLIGNNDIISTARDYVRAGLSVIPVRADGSKAPRVRNWPEYAARRPSDDLLQSWFGGGKIGIGIPGGPASGNLVVFDFETDKAFKDWAAKLTVADRALLVNAPVVRTPSGGAHVYCRVSAPVKGRKYAKDAEGGCLIETRGHGHYVIAPGSPGDCHPTGRRYRLLRDGWLAGAAPEPMPTAAFNTLTFYAAELNEYTRPAVSEVVGDRQSSGGGYGDRPGDHFNRRVGWSDVLCPHQWAVYRTSADATYWCRPDKHPPGVSASTGFCKGAGGDDLLYVFSTNADPFEAERCYSKFGAYAVQYHHGDFATATLALARAGYGVPASKPAKGVRP